MPKFVKTAFASAALMIAAGLLTMFATAPSNASPLPIAFDYTGTNTTSVNVTGVTGGTMLFSLILAAPAGESVDGNFSMDVFNASSNVISSVNFIGLSYVAGTNAYGDVTAPSNSPLFDFSLYDLMTWSVSVAASDLSPLTLNIFSALTPTFGPFSPQLTVEFTGDLQTAATPLPAALPLFAGGLGLIGLLGRRRTRKKTTTNAAA